MNDLSIAFIALAVVLCAKFVSADPILGCIFRSILPQMIKFSLGVSVLAGCSYAVSVWIAVKSDDFLDQL